MRAFRLAAGAASIGLLAAWACGGRDAFACTDDGQCKDGAAVGICEASGYCSFGDDTCPSGRRYGGLAPTGLAEMCVEPVDATTGTPGDGGIEVTTATTADATTDAPPPTTSTTLPVDPGSTGESSGDDATGPPPHESSSSGAGDDATTSGSTGEPIPACDVVFLDHFDSGLDPEWDTWSSAGSWFALDAETLYFSIAPSTTEWVSAGLVGQPHDLLGAHVRVELVPYADPTDSVGVWLTMLDAADCEIQIAVADAAVRGMSDGYWWDPVGVDPTQPIQLQLRADLDGLVHWEYSTDGGDSWIEVYADTPPCDFSSGRSALFAGGMHAYASSIIREVEWYERCEAP